jgi:IclR family acetate operon transcriptional repressor
MSDLKTPSLPSVMRAIEVLERITASPGGLTLTQFTRELGYPRSSTHCLLVTLERAGYLRRLSGRAAYLPGPRLSDLCLRAFPDAGLSRVANPFLLGLMWQTGLVVHMAVLATGQVILIAQVAPPGFPLATWVGQRMDWHCTALGKAIAAFGPAERIQTLIKAHSLARHNENTIVSTRRLVNELVLTQERGYAVDDEENIVGIRCLAVPVRGAGCEPLAAISVMGTTGEISEETWPKLVKALTAAAGRISLRLGDGSRKSVQEAAAAGRR